MDAPVVCVPSRFGADTLVFGIGNSARGDDGLGWAFLERAQELPGFRAQAEYRYQLQVEDALLVARFRCVVFVDASRDRLPEGFRWTRCRARAAPAFTTHALPPAAVLHYSQSLYTATPDAWLLALQGYHWGLHEGLSAGAADNLAAALDSCRDVVPA
jgi:hydrogenase maturation protease